MPRPEVVELLIPIDDESSPELSIVIPAMDEELTISDFLAWCREGLERAGIRGEILIVDSSADRTPELALALGARVLRVPKRGLGRAYIDAIPYIRGRWVLMGDADCTYDFRQLGEFVDALRSGADFVMGSRWKGSIEKGAMPPHHQYFGTPFTTWILNRVYSTHFTDIHCGMRAMTLDSLISMDIQSQSWEYASEIVIKSILLDLQTTEVPVHFLKDREGRVSHHKRMGWFSPFQAAWINLRAMFVYGSDFFLLWPGAILFIIGFLLTGATTIGPVDLGIVELSLSSQFLGVILAIMGLQSVLLGCTSRTFFDYTGRRSAPIARLFPYNRTVAIAFAVFVAGIAMCIPLVVTFISNDLSLPAVGIENHLALSGLFLVASGFLLFVFTLVINGALAAHAERLQLRQRSVTR